MSMIEKQVEELMRLKTSKLLRDNRSAQQIIGNAIDAIQELSAKLSSSNLNGGWHIVADGDLPKDKQDVLVSTNNGSRYRAIYVEDSGTFVAIAEWVRTCITASKVVAWQPLPEPYKSSK